MSVTRESVLEELDVDVFACLSWKVILDTPRFGNKGTGWVTPTDPPETLPGAAEYAMAKSTFKPINCAFAGEASKRNRNVKQQDKQTKTSTSSSSNTLSLITDTKIETVNFFYNIPFPVVSIALGIGAGVMKTNTSLTETSGNSSNSDDSDLSTPVSEGFIHIGLPFWSIIEFHIGYHLMSVSKLDLTNESGISVTDYSLDKKNYTGGMTTIGVQIAL